MNTNTTFKNINTAERTARFVAAMAVILFAMHSSIAGGTVAFVALVGISIVLASMAIIGWCPFVALANKVKSARQNSHHGDHFPHGHHA